MNASDLDRLGWAVTDLSATLKRMGVTATLRILVRENDHAVLAAASAGTSWASRAGPEGGLRIAGAVIGIGG